MICIACATTGPECYALSGAGDERYRKYKCVNCGTEMEVTVKCGEEDIKRILRKNQKIAAIRLWRWVSGEGLMEAKKYIDKLHVEVLSENEEDIE